MTVNIDVREQRGKATARPRFKLRTWGTLRVSLTFASGGKLARLIDGSLTDSGTGQSGHQSQNAVNDTNTYLLTLPGVTEQWQVVGDPNVRIN
jgi:hypothetical protein